ncbi:MAG: MerR family transcriptional regulator [Bacteroidaceae bacterium]|nr:MerR family transcriptional regulator [Bacteroidaceae bacterium]
MALNKNKDLKLYYSIGEVAQMFNVTETLLRFWEKEFPTISPQKAGRGIRQYTKADIEQVRLVHHLVKERGMTLQGARDTIRRDKSKTVNRNIEVIEKLKDIRSQLQTIGKELNGLV